MSSFRKFPKLPSRPKLPAASPSSDPPSPALSTVHATGFTSSPKTQTPTPTPTPPSPASTAPESIPTPSPSSTSRSKRRERKPPSEADTAASSSSSTGSLRWFSRKGTWPRTNGKSAPVTEVAQESASRESLTPVPPPEDCPAPSLESNTNEQKLPLEPPTNPPVMPSAGSAAPPLTDPAAVAVEVPVTAPEEPASAPAPETTLSEEPKDDAKLEPPPREAKPTSSWFGWWYGQPAPKPAPQPAEQDETTKEPAAEPIQEPMQEPVKEPVKEPPPPQELPTKDDKSTSTPAEPPAQPPSKPASIAGEIPLLNNDGVDPRRLSRPRSWFGLWGGYVEGEDPTANPADKADKAAEEPVVPAESLVPVPAPAPAAPAPPAAAPEPERPSKAESIMSSQTARESRISVDSTATSKGYGWAFWYRDRGNAASSTTTINNTEGEVAVAGTATESKPQKAKVKEIPANAPPGAGEVKPMSSVAALREESRRSNASISRPSTPRPSQPKRCDTSASMASVVPPATPHTPIVEDAARKKLQKILPQNHLLPDFGSCYSRLEEPSLMQKLLRNPPQPSKKHLHLARHPPKIKRAVAIGVHGFFPMKLVRTVLGEPTGTSIRFAKSASSAIKRWAEKNGVEVEVEQIALEGEGKVADRVDMLWKLLSNWMDQVRSADFVLMAAHSQGVVVGTQLLARLIEEGCVEKKRIGFLAMAGINLGPFGHLPQTLLSGSAKELFEFQKQQSPVSQRYYRALRIVVAHDVRICYVGSIDDQLVSMESSTFTNISHPYIFRAVFVDGRVHAPDFLSHLVGFTMKLRNLGISDHGLIRELSAPLAGSLYGGEGHSRIYDDGAVYDLGVRHALETLNCPEVPLKVDEFLLPKDLNPYYLPWAVRGLLEEPFVRNDLGGECLQLLKQFEKWKPVTKVLKDVKFRLEGIRSKL